MRVILATILVVCLSTLTAHSQLTDKDLQKIREIIKSENIIIQSEMTALELRLTQRIQESENRLRSELNAQLNARMNDFTIVFGITSGGFFLLFASVLLINALRNRPIIDNKTNAALILATISGILYLTSTAIAFEGDKKFGKITAGEITCTKLTILDNYRRPGITLAHHTRLGGLITINGKNMEPRVRIRGNYIPQISLYGSKQPDPIVRLSAFGEGGELRLDSNPPHSKHGSRIHLEAYPTTATMAIEEAKPPHEARGITLSTKFGTPDISIKE